MFKKCKNRIWVAYPQRLFEVNNMAQIFSSIAGNIFGMKEVDSLRLEEMEWPKRLAKSFPGPKYGIKGIRKMSGIKDRPLSGTIIKPKLGLTATQHSKVAYKAWKGGLDIVKDDENLTSQSFNKFKSRMQKTIKLKKKAEKETGEKKFYLANVSAETFKMLERTKVVNELKNEHIMVDILTVGFSGVQTLRDRSFSLALHGHRAMHAAITRKKDHGISMKAIASASRLIGIDQLHIGTGVGKMEGGIKEVQEIQQELIKPLYGLKKVFPVCSGGLNPGHIPSLIKAYGKDIIVQAGGGVHGNPLGTKAGAKAMRQAIDATMNGKSLKEKAKQNKELAAAIKKWGVYDV